MHQILPSSVMRVLEPGGAGRAALPAGENIAVDGAIMAFVDQLGAARAAVDAPATSLLAPGEEPMAEGAIGDDKTASGKDEEETGKILPVGPGNGMPIAVALPAQVDPASVLRAAPSPSPSPSPSSIPTPSTTPTIRFAQVVEGEKSARTPAPGVSDEKTQSVPGPVVARPVPGSVQAQAVPASTQAPAIAPPMGDTPRSGAIALAQVAIEGVPAKAPVFEIAMDPAKASPRIAASAIQSAATDKAGGNGLDRDGGRAMPAIPQIAGVRAEEKPAIASLAKGLTDEKPGVVGSREPGASDAASPARAPVPGEMRVTSQPASVPAAHTLQPMQHTDMAQMIDRLVEARMAARSGDMQMAVSNADFGKVSVRLESGLAAGSLSFTLNNADPDFQPAVQAALAQSHASERVAAPQDSARADANPQRGDTQGQAQSHAHAHSPGHGSAGGQQAAGAHGFADQNRSQNHGHPERTRPAANGAARNTDTSTDSGDARADRGGIFA